MVLDDARDCHGCHESIDRLQSTTPLGTSARVNAVKTCYAEAAWALRREEDGTILKKEYGAKKHI